MTNYNLDTLEIIPGNTPKEKYDNACKMKEIISEVNGKVIITKTLYYNLKVEAETLRRLENGGVDNWEFYGEALNPEDECALDEFEEALEKKLLPYDL